MVCLLQKLCWKASLGEATLSYVKSHLNNMSQVMAKRTMTYVFLSMGVLALGYGIWKTTFRNAYETATIP